MLDTVIDWPHPEMRRALREHDIATVFRMVMAAGVSQRVLAQSVGIAQSEVSEILAGRQVRAVAVLEKITTGLGIPRGYVGLAYTTGATADAEPPPEVAEDVQRRRFLAAASQAVFGAVVGIGEPGLLSLPYAEPPSRVGPWDVREVIALTERFRVLDHTYGGGAIASAVQASAAQATGLARGRMTGKAPGTVRRELLSAIAELHRLAGSCTYDAGESGSRRYFATALDLAREAGNRAQVAQVIDTVGQVELMNDRPNDALKLFQLAMMERGTQRTPALLSGRAGKAYAKLGYRDSALRELDKAREAATSESVAVATGVEGLIGASLRNLGDWPGAIAAEERSLVVRNADPGDVRGCAQATTSLATLHFRSGDTEEGSRTAQRALELAEQVRSKAVVGGLRPLAEAAAQHRDSQCTDIARQASRMAAESA